MGRNEALCWGAGTLGLSRLPPPVPPHHLLSQLQDGGLECHVSDMLPEPRAGGLSEAPGSLAVTERPSAFASVGACFSHVGSPWPISRACHLVAH